VYAIIEDSGSQLKVSNGDVLDVDLRERPKGDSLVFDRVLAIGDCDNDDAARVGRPYLDGASVSAEVLSEVRGKKIHVQKYKRRKGYRRKIGHRQGLLRVKIASIDG
jgi:large subunit ribosomal protein L21